MKELIPGRIATWTGKGPFGMELRSYAYRNEEVVWIDPVTPTHDLAEVEAFGKPDHLILTMGGHDRDALDLQERYGCTLWVPINGGDRHIPYPDHMYSEGSQLPAGLRAIACLGHLPDEHALVGECDGKSFAVVGDSLLRVPNPGLLVALGFLRQPKGEFQHIGLIGKLNGLDTKKASQGAKCLLTLELDIVLPTHGEPVLEDAERKLLDSVAAWA